MGGADNVQRGRPSMTRVAGWQFRSEEDAEDATCDLLDREVARAGTPVTQYGTDGHFLWLNGVPGAEMRGVLAELRKLGWVPSRRGAD
jgi:hypothetical protein